MLEVKSLVAGYGLVEVLRDVTVTVGPGARVCVLGRNGVGKTTLLRTVMGLTPPKGGEVRFYDDDVAGLAPYEIARRGIGYVSQDRALFPELTVEQNLFLAVRNTRTFKSRLSEVLDYFPILKERLNQTAGTLSGGQQQFAAITRALLGQPRLLLLDEPSAGIQPSVVNDLARLLPAVLEQASCGLLLVEQDRRLAAAVTDQAYILDRQSVVAQGRPADLEKSGDLERYLAF